MEKRINRKFTLIIFGVAVWLVLMLATGISAHASPQHRFGQDPGRIGPITENDHHTSQWARFHFNYHFTSGMNYRYDLGRPTTFDSFVPVDVFTVNVRRDANVSFRPPSYGIFSGEFATDPSNRFFSQPVNPNFRFFELENPNVMARYDTLLMGVNAPHLGNPINMHNVGTPGTLPHTSIGGNDIIPFGVTNSNYTTSMVNTQFSNGFLPPTSIRD